MRWQAQTALCQRSTTGKGHVASSFLADQQSKQSDSYQQGKQNTDDERNNRVPTGLDLFRSRAFLRRSDAQPEEKFVHRPKRPRCQEVGGSNCPWTDDASLWRRHSISCSAKVTLEAKAMKHAPATSNNSKPMKLRSQITLAIEHIEMTSSSRQ